MSKTIRVQWEYPDFAYQLADENYEDFEAGDWFYDEITRKYYQIVKNAGYYAISRPDNGTVGVLCTSIKDTFGTHDTSRLVKISPDQVHIVFGNMPKERD